MDHYIEQLVDLIPPSANQLLNVTLAEARRRMASGEIESVRDIEGSFALITREGKRVKLARSLDRPMRYFLAKRTEGPALIVAERIDVIFKWLQENGLSDQFHPSYTRMVPAHYIVEIQLVGCPDPDPTYTRFFDPRPNTMPSDPGEIGRRYISALADAVANWLLRLPEGEPVGVCFSGGIDSGAVFLVTYHVLR